MWKLWHRLFGWDYVVTEVYCQGRHIEDVIVRVQKTADGHEFVQYGGFIEPLPKHVKYLTK